MSAAAVFGDWAIQHRAETCAATGQPFAPGDFFYTLLFVEGDGFRRQDLSEEAWRQRNDNIRPFSFWRARFEPPPLPAPEPLAKEDAEALFRRLLGEHNPAHANACYILAAMLERKRILKQIKSEEANGARVLIYEQPKTGDVFLVPDVQLHLDELESVQTEVAALLNSSGTN